MIAGMEYKNNNLSIKCNFIINMASIILFDVDGTLTVPRKTIEPKIMKLLIQLKKKYSLGIVGGSNYEKIQEQLVTPLEQFFDYTFCENGIVAYKGNQLIGKKKISNELGEKNLQIFINYVLNYISQLEIPIKRGTFIEFRNGMINISPIGRNCSYEERLEFQKFDKKHKIREIFVNHLKQNFPNFNLTYSIGGQISFDVFPMGWDKTQCLQYLRDDFDKIYFFGDKIDIGGNDYELYHSEYTESYAVSNPNETLNLCTKMFL